MRVPEEWEVEGYGREGVMEGNDFDINLTTQLLTRNTKNTVLITQK